MRPSPSSSATASLLAAGDEPFPITLGEGGTPLIHARRLGAELGLENLHLKFEGTNPTGSFKDRGMVLAVNRAVAARCPGRGVRLDRQHLGVGGRLRRRGRPAVPRHPAGGQGGARQAGAGAGRRRAR